MAEYEKAAAQRMADYESGGFGAPPAIPKGKSGGRKGPKRLFRPLGRSSLGKGDSTCILAARPAPAASVVTLPPPGR